MSRRRRDKEQGLFDQLNVGLSVEETDTAIFSDLAERSKKSMQLFQDGQLQIGNFVLTTTHLSIPEDVTVSDWRKVGDILFRLEGSIQWLIGDWLVYGEEREWGSTPQIAEMLGKEVKSLYDYTYVARNVNFRYRTENLSFGHHKLVASLSEENQSFWLQEAESNNWTIAEMRQAIRKNKKNNIQENTSALEELQEVKKQVNAISSKLGRVLRGETINAKQKSLLINQISDVQDWLAKAKEQFLKE